ncbi:hypothetical protein EXIGUO8H_20786 [Exiguobacterium sp. 8H]|nr:hypothetical protein EXIGUO8A_11853 [Exiguobacterium sp. 8A]VXB70511.1 hypothetical protein EXIGUO8H_20786 [Exiguobacterium sp. 8H]
MSILYFQSPTYFRHAYIETLFLNFFSQKKELTSERFYVKIQLNFTTSQLFLSRADGGTSPMMSQQPTRNGTVLILAANAER